MSGLSFLLVMGVGGAIVISALALPLALLAPWLRASSPFSRRAAAAWALTLPPLTAAGVALAVATPSLLYGMGLAEDHCDDHAHHLHLCWWHGGALSPSLAWLGAAAWVTLALRVGRALWALAHTERLGQQLRAISRFEGGTWIVPASLPICHTVGTLSPAILLSERLLAHLPPEEQRAVLSHERAHLLHHDTRWAALLSLLACANPLAAPWLRVWRAASEDAADDHAAQQTHPLIVAQALLSVARLQLRPLPGFGFGSSHLARRVERLLSPPAPTASPRALHLLGGALALLGGVTLHHHHREVHHAVEEVLAVLLTH